MALPRTSIIVRMSTHHLKTAYYLKYYHDAQKLPMLGLMMMMINNNHNNNNNNNNNGQISGSERGIEEDLELQ